jgi:uncharacterized membrane protein
MVDWFAIISIKNILLVGIGFIVGRFWRLGKKVYKQLLDEKQNEQNKV